MFPPWWILLLTAALRLLVCLRTVVPGRDAATYLWMAERAAAGDANALFATVFHPAYSASVATLLWLCPGLDTVVAGQVVAAGAATLAVVPIWRLARRFGGDAAAAWAGVGYAGSAWFARHPAECMSEGLFYLAITSAMWWTVRTPPRPLAAGVAAAVAWWTRPEGAVLVALLPAWSWWQGRRRDAMSMLAIALPSAALLPLAFWLAGAGWMVTPKLWFNYEQGIGGESATSGHWWWQVLRLPGHALEELGWLWLPLAIVGVARMRAWRPREPATLLLVPLAIQCLVVPFLFSHHRFLSGPGVLVFAFAGSGAVAVRQWLRGRPRAMTILALAALLASELRIAAVRNSDRAIERDLGLWLRPRLGAGDLVVSDMPRLCFYAGVRPPPPRPLTVEELLLAATAQNCRFAVFVSGRSGIETADLRAKGLEPMELPALLSRSTGSERVRLFQRTSQR